MVTRGSNGPSTFASVSSDGSTIVFLSDATNLAGTDDNGKRDVYVYQARKKAFRNLTKDGVADFSEPTISGDGTTVAAVSVDPGLVSGDSDGKADVFLFRLDPESVTLIGASTTSAAVSPSLDTAGRGLAYVTKRGGYWQVVAHDSHTGLEAIASQTLTGQLGNGDSFFPSLSGASQRLAFSSKATNLGDGDNDPTVFWTAPGHLSAVAAGQSPVISRDGSAFAYLRDGQAVHRDALGAETLLGHATGTSLSKNAVVWPNGEELIARAVGKGSDVPMNPVYKAINPIEHSVTPLEIASSRAQAQFLDLNGDGRKDLFIPDRVETTRPTRAFVGLAQNDGSFQSSIQNLGGLILTYGLADLDGDGDLDVVFISQRCQPGTPPAFQTTTIYTLRTAFNDGNGQFSPGTVRDLPHYANKLLVGNLNDDGIPDIALIQDAYDPPSSSAIALFGTSGGIYSGAPQTIPISTSFQGVVLLSDITGDGVDDIVMLDSSSQNFVTLPNSGTGTFLSPVSTPFGSSIGSSPYLVSVDSNSDGRQDLLVSKSIPSTVSLWTSNGTGGFSKIREHDTKGSQLFVDDVNGDGILDWVVNGSALTTFLSGEAPAVISPGVSGMLGFQSRPGEQSELLALYHSNLLRLQGQDGRYGLPVVAPNSVSSEWLLGDFNGDLLPDLLSLQHQSSILHHGDTHRTFASQEPAVIEGLPPGFDRYSDFTEDFDSDGELDLVLYSSAGPILIAYGDGEGRFSILSESVIPSSGSRLRVSDLNSDGRPDLITIGGLDPVIRYWLNLGERAFSPSQTLSAPNATRFEVGDIDGDGVKDLLLIKIHNSIERLSWTDGGGFGNATVLIPPQSNPPFEEWILDLRLDDLNLDGRDDLLGQGAAAFFVSVIGCELFPMNTPSLVPSVTPHFAKLSTTGGLQALTHNVLGYRSAQVRSNLVADFDGNPLRSRILLETGSVWSVFTQQPGSVLQEAKRLFVGEYRENGAFQKDIDFDGDFDIFIPRTHGFSFLNR